MINKKSGMIAMVAVIAVAFTTYAAYELAPPTVMVSGHGQMVDFTFEEQVERYELVVIGKIIDLGTKVFIDEIIDIDEDGNEYVFRTDHVPMREITILISEKIKDGIDWASNTVTVYDRGVRGDIGSIGGEKAIFNYEHAIDYHIGDRGIFMIESDRGLYLSGFAGYYPIIPGKTTITSEFDAMLGNDPIDLASVIEITD